jgi:lipid A 3-O-deacylase
MMKRMIRKITLVLGACALLVCSRAVFPIEHVSVEIGRGEDRTSLLRIAVEEPWRKQQAAQGGEWQFAGYWEFSAAVWDNRDESTADVGFTPVFRWERASIYVEGALGFHLVQTHISAARTFSTAFQFAEHVAAGIRLRKYEVGLGLQHLSNGGLNKPNPGINFVLMRVRYALD